MQELTFETILRLPQMELKKRLKAELKSRGYPVTDKPGYLYAEGTIPVLLVAHMDTVHRQPVEQIGEVAVVVFEPQQRLGFVELAVQKVTLGGHVRTLGSQISPHGAVGRGVGADWR